MLYFAALLQKWRMANGRGNGREARPKYAEL